MTKLELTDWLFRVGAYWGVKVDPVPRGLIECRLSLDGQLFEDYTTEINPDHYLADWLLNECEGPWDMRMYRPRSKQQTYLAFARVADAMIFRFKMS